MVTPTTVYVALQHFCEQNDRPRRLMEEAGLRIQQNQLGRRMRSEDLLDALRDADAVLAGVEPYNAELLAALPKLRCISRCGVGTDSVDLAAAQRHHIAVFTTIDEVITPVAQMTVTMILALARNVPRHLGDFRSGLWRKWTGSLLSEWTIGLVGFGRIGRTVERYLRPFGPRVLVSDPACDPKEVPETVQWRPLPSLLAESDLVSLHLARPQGLGPLLGPSELAAMKPGGYLVNTARGYLVDETALYAALQSGHLSGAALDVFKEEPYTGPLAALPQVLCTPHVATLTRASRAAIEWRAAMNIVTFFTGVERGLPASPVSLSQ